MRRQLESDQDALVIDVHRISLYSSAPESLRSLHFDVAANVFPATHSNDHLLTVDWERLLIASTKSDQEVATAFISIGPLSDTTSFARSHSVRYPRLTLSSSLSTSNVETPDTSTRTMGISINVPSLHLDMSKAAFDGLQLWADWLSKLVENANSNSTIDDLASSHPGSRDPSLIGSRYFLAQRRADQDSEILKDAGRSKPATSQIVVKVTIAEGKSII
jgi:autophagy-related protein 2